MTAAAVPRGLVAVDTSVAVPLLVATHSAHGLVREWATNRVLALSGHAAVETYSVLTRLPADLRVDPRDAVALIDDSFAEILALSASAARRAHRDLARASISGGAVYDALVAMAAKQHGHVLATRDARAMATYRALRVQVVVVGEAP